MFFHRYEIFGCFSHQMIGNISYIFAFVLTASVQIRQCFFPPLWYMNLDVDSERCWGQGEVKHPWWFCQEKVCSLWAVLVWKLMKIAWLHHLSNEYLLCPSAVPGHGDDDLWVTRSNKWVWKRGRLIFSLISGEFICDTFLDQKLCSLSLSSMISLRRETLRSFNSIVLGIGLVWLLLFKSYFSPWNFIQI